MYYVRLFILQAIQKTSKLISYARGVVLFGKIIYVEGGTTIRGIENIKIGSRCQFFKGSTINAKNGKISFGDNVTICNFSIINSAGGYIKIDSGTTVGDFSNLYGQGGLVIEKDVMLASCIQIVPNEHTFSDTTKAIKFQPEVSKGIRIKEGAWIGTNVVILDDVTIGKNSVIGAGSIVNNSIPEFSIAFGVPSKIKKKFNFENNTWERC